MSKENKPDVDADPVDSKPVDETEAIRQRITEGIEQQSGDVLAEAMKAPEEIKPEVAQTSGGTSDVDTQKVSPVDSKDANTVALRLIETSTGRKFDNVEDAKKYLANLNSLVGEQNVAKAREAEKTLTTLVQKFGKENAGELEKYITDIILAKKQPEPIKFDKKDDELVKRLEQLEHDTQLGKLEKKYPIASEVAELVALDAKEKGISYIEAFENSPLKSLVELKAKEETLKSPIVTPSNKVNVNYKRAQELGDKVLTGRATPAETQELVSTVLGIK